MGLLDLVLDAFLALVLILGSISLGYFLLRTGWHKIRILDKSYKIGWSIVLGAILSIVIVIIAFVFSLLPFLFFGFRDFLFLGLVTTSAIAGAGLTLRRKFFARKRVIVAIPKKVVGAKIASKKTIQKFEERGLIRVAELDAQKIEAIKKRLAEEEEKREVEKAKEAVKPLPKEEEGPEEKEIVKPEAKPLPKEEKGEGKKPTKIGLLSDLLRKKGKEIKIIKEGKGEKPREKVVEEKGGITKPLLPMEEKIGEEEVVKPEEMGKKKIERKPEIGWWGKEEIKEVKELGKEIEEIEAELVKEKEKQGEEEPTIGLAEKEGREEKKKKALEELRKKLKGVK